MHIKALCAGTLLLALTACGITPIDRALSGGALVGSSSGNLFGGALLGGAPRRPDRRSDGA